MSQPTTVRHLLRGVAAATVTAAVLGSWLVHAPAAQAAGTAYAWTGQGADDEWANTQNWTPQGVPGTGDSVVIAPPTTGSCLARPVGAPTATLVDLDIHETEPSPGTRCGASLGGGAITVSGHLEIHGAVVSTPLTMLAGSTGDISPNVTDVDQNTQLLGGLTVAGSLTLTGNTIDHHPLLVGAGVALKTVPGGVITSSGPNHLLGFSCCVNPPRLVNEGRFVSTGGTTTVRAAQIDQAGILELTSGGRLESSGAANTAAHGSSYVGAGAWVLGSGSVTTLTGTQTLAQDFVLVQGGPGISGTNTVAGTFTLAGTGTYFWQGGDLEADMTISHGAGLSAEGDAGAQRSLDGRDGANQPVRITNHGRIRFVGGASYYARTGGRIDNASDGELLLAADTQVGSDCCGLPGIIHNAGGKVVAAGNGGPVVLDNVQLESVGGSVEVSAALRLELTGGGTDLLSGSPEILGGGTLAVASPTTVAGAIPVRTGTTLLLDEYPGTLDGNATITGAGDFRWRGGAVSGNLTLSPQGGSTLDVPADPANHEHKHVLDPHGPSKVRFTTATRLLAGTTAAPNQVDLVDPAVLTFAGATTVGPDVVLSHGTIVNTGSLTVAAQTTHPVSLDATELRTSGRVTVASGRLEVDDGYLQSGGTTSLAAGTNLRLGGSSAQVVLTGGQLTGRGTVTGRVVNSRASVVPGLAGAGTLRVNGSYTQGRGGALLARLAARGGTLLAVSGTSSVRGRLKVTNAHVPRAGRTRVALTSTGALGAPLGCVTTTGPGTSGPQARHWTAAVAGHRLVLRSVKGARTRC
ncbi:hypothetical protein [Nocardioides sp.]|uniref:hypothetical protein n=1 Tax=Nocardioides sp. TaxID=35761 RepID=UPI002729012B|nr:hypothetical protein [Nocardioides sp.]MDO9455719.1 hypothetical protein [Nocardioides sp.]